MVRELAYVPGHCSVIVNNFGRHFWLSSRLIIYIKGKENKIKD
jgi:hypothetical protein